MPIYPVFYTIQNGPDSTQNVFSLNFNEEQQGDQLRLKHILKEFPINLEEGFYHLRFKIQCNETEPKILAWIDPSNLNARAPIINNSIYIKILLLNKEGDSKIYSQGKIAKAKASAVPIEKPPQQQQQQPKQPQQTQQQAAPITKTQPKTLQTHHKGGSQPDLVHSQHMKAPNLLDDDYHDQQTDKSEKVEKSLPQKSLVPQQQQQQQQPQQQQDTKNILEDDFDIFGEQTNQTQQPAQQQNKGNNQPSGGIFDFDEDEFGPPVQAKTAVNETKLGNPGVFVNNHNLIDDHTLKAPESEFDEMVKAKKSEYTDNEGNIIREKLIQVKERVKLALEEKAVQDNKDVQDNAIKQEADKKIAIQKFSSKLKDWKESNGVRKDIRTLLSTLQNVLWPGANWVPVSFFDLSTDENLKESVNKVKKRFHPDKNRANLENLVICQSVIDEVNQAYKDYNSKKL